MIESFGFSEFMFLVRSAGWTLLLTAIALVFGGLLGGLPINAIITRSCG